MLKIYMVNGLTYQFEEGEQPEDAVEVKAVEPPKKAAEPENKAVKPANKSRKVARK